MGKTSQRIMKQDSLGDRMKESRPDSHYHLVCVNNSMNDFYVYVYLDQQEPGDWKYKNIYLGFKPFYVGKGKGKRDVSHLCDYMLKRNSSKSAKIKSIIAKTGELPLHTRIFHNLTETDALTIEQDFIKTFGRKDNNTGILRNLTDGGDGIKNVSLEVRQKISDATSKRLYQYSLDGDFIKEWNSGQEVEDQLGISSCNISTSIKRNGSCGGFIWFYKNFGKRIKGKKKYQMPVRYNNIKQLDPTGKVLIKIFKNALEIEEHLNLRSGARNKIYECLNKKLKTAYGYQWSL